MAAPKLFALLAHPITQEAIQSLSQGKDPKGIFAGIAGDFVAQEVAKALGAKLQAKEPARKPAPRAAKVVEDDGNVIDAEYTVIREEPGFKHRRKG